MYFFWLFKQTKVEQGNETVKDVRFLEIIILGTFTTGY